MQLTKEYQASCGTSRSIIKNAEVRQFLLSDEPEPFQLRDTFYHRFHHSHLRHLSEYGDEGIECDLQRQFLHRLVLMDFERYLRNRGS